MLKLTDYSYFLPETHIAQTPLEPRDTAKLMVLNRSQSTIKHKIFRQLPELLRPNDVLVLNDTKVMPGRILGHKHTGKSVEILLLNQTTTNTWQAMTFPGLKLNNQLIFGSLQGQVVSRDSFSGQVEIKFSQSGNQLLNTIFELGQTPIPPYISSNLSENHLRERYQTIYAKQLGSAAAPTAGLHFTPELMQRLQDFGISIETITLHVGPGTFQRLWPENLQEHRLHSEHFSISQQTATNLIRAKRRGQRIIAVGTTTTRALEASVVKLADKYQFHTGWQSTNIFIHPPYQFKFVDGLITNFHLPESSLLMLVAAFTSQPQTTQSYRNFDTSLVGRAYQQAIQKKYRFYSFGDAMLIV